MLLSAPAGHGIGLRHEHYGELLDHGPVGVDWMEVISENLFGPGGRPWAVLERVRREVPVVLHGVSMGLGNAAGVDARYLDRLAEVIERVEPAIVSDHLCWGGYGGHHAHDLLPLPYTEEVLDHLVTQISRVQERLGRRMLVENVSSYLQFRASTMPEWEFLAELCRRADCCVLLDINNIVVSSRNHGFDARAYVDAIPADRVAQLHLAGHTQMDGYVLDSHVGPVPDVVWELYRHALRRFGTRSTLIEWDAEVPAFEQVVAESKRARELAREHGTRAAVSEQGARDAA